MFMVWYPYTGTVPLSLVWPNGIATTSLGLAALVVAARLALLALRAARSRTVAVPHPSVTLPDEQEVTHAAAL
jgi:hypothetical protein